MANRSRVGKRGALVVGWLALAVTLLLAPLGVHAVRADDRADASTEVCPLPAEAGDAGVDVPAAPAARVPGADVADRVGTPEPLDADEFVPLNTQGYNYRPESIPAAPDGGR